MICPHLFFSQKRWIMLFSQYCKSHIKLKGRSKSSQEWLTRQMKDPYVEKAKMKNYRCRSAFKLLEIDEKYRLFHPGLCVLDCGATPGSWTQVAVAKTNADGKELSKPKGTVFAVDLLPLYPLEGACMIGLTDLSSKEGQAKVEHFLNGRHVDLFISDAAPNATGVKGADHDAIIHLAYMLVRFSLKVSRVGATLLLKIWDGGSSSTFIKDIGRFYSTVKRVKPPSSRADSSEMYILAIDFKGLQNS